MIKLQQTTFSTTTFQPDKLNFFFSNLSLKKFFIIIIFSNEITTKLQPNSKVLPPFFKAVL